MRVEAPVEDQERLRELGEALGNSALVRVLETVGQAIVDMRGTDAADPRLVLEVALVRLSRRDAGPPLQMLIERLERVERAVAGGAGAPPATAGAATTGPASGAPSPRPAAGGRRAAKSDPEGSTRAPAAGSEARTGLPRPVRSPRSARCAVPPANRRLHRDAAAGDAAAPTAGDASGAPTGDSGGDSTVTGPLPDIELDDVIVAWAEILPELPMATRTAVQTAQPLRLEGAVIVFGVPPNLIEAAKPRFHRAADSIREAFSRRLGRTMKFKIAPAEDFTAIDAAAPRGAKRGGARGAGPDEPPIGEPPLGEPPPELESEEHIDLTETVDADTVDIKVSSVGLLEQQLGATVVEEKSRD